MGAGGFSSVKSAHARYSCEEARTSVNVSEFKRQEELKFTAERVRESMKARKDLLSKNYVDSTLEMSNVVASMALSTPESYPMLDLSEKAISDTDIPNVLKLIQVYPFAQSLDLFGNSLTFRSCPLTPLSYFHSSIKVIGLGHNQLGPVSEESRLGEFLKGFPTMEKLEMTECGLGDEDVGRIGEELRSFSAIKVLILRGNHITNHGVRKLSISLGKCESLEELDLRRTSATSQSRAYFHSPKLLVQVDKSVLCCKNCSLV